MIGTTTVYDSYPSFWIRTRTLRTGTDGIFAGVRRWFFSLSK